MALSTDSTQQLDQILELSWGVPLSEFQPGNVGDLSPHCIEASRSIAEVENMQLMVQLGAVVPPSYRWLNKIAWRSLQTTMLGPVCHVLWHAAGQFCMKYINVLQLLIRRLVQLLPYNSATLLEKYLRFSWDGRPFHWYFQNWLEEVLARNGNETETGNSGKVKISARANKRFCWNSSIRCSNQLVH